MKYKHQGSCYRNIDGRKYEDYSDLCYADEENKKIIKEAKEKYRFVRVIKRSEDLKAVFVSN